MNKCILLALILVSQIVAGAGVPPQCEALVAAESRQARTSVFNPDNLLRLDVASREVAGLCDGTVLGWSWQVRAGATRDRVADGAERSDVDTVLRQVYRRFDSDGPWSLTVGKKLRGWDVGYIAQPIDFLGDPRNTRDLEDRLSRRQASTFLALDRIGTDWTTSFIVGENRQRPDVRPQAIATAERNVRGTNVQLIAQKPADQPLGAGGGVSTVWGTALELHGSFFTRRGNERPVHLSLVNGDLRFYPADQNPVGAHLLHDDRWYSRWVVGGQWTAASGLNVLLEWSHDDRGLSPAEWRHLLALTRFHAAGGKRQHRVRCRDARARRREHAGLRIPAFRLPVRAGRGRCLGADECERPQHFLGRAAHVQARAAH